MQWDNLESVLKSTVHHNQEWTHTHKNRKIQEYFKFKFSIEGMKLTFTEYLTWCRLY